MQVRGVQAAVTGGLVRERSQSLCIDCSASETRLVQGVPLLASAAASIASGD